MSARQQERHPRAGRHRQQCVRLILRQGDVHCPGLAEQDGASHSRGRRHNVLGPSFGSCSRQVERSSDNRWIKAVRSFGILARTIRAGSWQQGMLLRNAVRAWPGTAPTSAGATLRALRWTTSASPSRKHRSCLRPPAQRHAQSLRHEARSTRPCRLRPSDFCPDDSRTCAPWDRRKSCTSPCPGHVQSY